MNITLEQEKIIKLLPGNWVPAHQANFVYGFPANPQLTALYNFVLWEKIAVLDPHIVFILHDNGTLSSRIDGKLDYGINLDKVKAIIKKYTTFKNFK